MASDGEIDYSQVLADLISKRDKLNAAIAGIETMLGIQAATTPVSSVKADVPANTLGEGAFLGMSIADATRKLLSVRRRNMRTEEIVNELRSGGIVFSGEAGNTVGSVLNRTYTAGGPIVRVSRGVWGLAEWHPRLRKRPPTNGDESNGSAGAGEQGGAAPSSDADDAGPENGAEVDDLT